jgi:heme-degrading monooxygenase HmoA
MDLAIRKNGQSVSLVTVFTVEPRNQQKLVQILQDGTETVLSKQPGYIGTSVLKSVDGRRVIAYSQWRSAKDIEAYRAKPDVTEAFKRVMAIATFDPTVSEVAYVHRS